MEHPFYIACALLNRPQNEDNTHYNLGTSLYQNGTHEDVCFITLYYIFPRRLWQKAHDFKCPKCEKQLGSFFKQIIFMKLVKMGHKESK